MVRMFELLWKYQPAGDLQWSWADRLELCPREPDMLIYGVRLAGAASMRAWLAIYHRLQIIGRENLPAEESFVLVANHASHLDALCMLSALRVQTLHRAFPAAARDYFFVNLPRMWLSAVLVNATPFSRDHHLRQSLDICRRILAQPGNTLILFPEGTRSATGQLGAFRRGIGSLLAGTNVPVIPCALRGTARAWPKGAIFPRPLPVRLVIGKPRTYATLEPGHDSAVFVADDLRSAVEQLLCN
jgi:1-acyl-sn-glycerol-3-phosphate acyltransferase